MDTHRKPTFHTIPEGVIDLNQSVGSVSTNVNNSSVTPKTPVPTNNSSGKSSWMNRFSGGLTRQTSVTNGSTTTNHQSELDLSYITSRLIVMKTPHEHSFDVSSRSTAESARELLDTKYPDLYMLYSLDQLINNESPYRKELFHNRVLDLPLFDEKQSSPLVAVLCFCQKITEYLLESPSHVAVLHCNDTKSQLAFGACSLLAYHKIFPRADQVIHYYELHRNAHPILTMSQKRYIQYVCDLSNGIIERPHFDDLLLKTLILSPVPLVNRKKTSCRPFVDIYDQQHKKIFTTYQETAKLRVYSALDSACIIPINLPFNGDLTIHITHAAISNARRTHEGGVRICELTINSNFSTINQRELSYSRNELDGLDVNEKNAQIFRLTFDITNHQKPVLNKQDSFAKHLDKTLQQPLALFKDENELKQNINEAEKQFKHQNGENEIPISPVPVVPRGQKAKDESISPDHSDPSSPRSSIYSFAPLSPSSFVNPRHNPFKPPATEISPRSSQITSPPLNDEKLNNDKTFFGALLDIEKDIPSNQSILERSLSSDTQQHEFYSSIDSQPNFLDDDFEFDQSLLKRNISPSTLPPPMTATKHSEIEQKSSSNSNEKSNTTINTPDYSAFKPTESVPSTQKQPEQTKTPSSSIHITKPKSKLEDCLGGIGEFKKDSPPATSSAIGVIRKATIAKDLDPIVAKVQDWTEGKKRNIRALLCSLSKVTWPECKWGGCQMNELLTPEQVKKVYRRAVIYIHPDKLRGDPNEPLAKLIFVELNEAWSQFEQETN